MADVDVFGPRSINALQAGRVGFVETFARKPGINADITIAYNPDFEVLGTNAVSADVSYYAEGGIAVATHGAATDSTIILPHLDTGQSAWANVTWGTDQETHWGCTLKTGAALTNTTIWAGLKLTNTPTIATDDDQVYFRYVNGTHTKWTYVYSLAGTDSAATGTEVGPTIAAATEYRLWITITPTRKANMFINGTLVYTTPALTDAVDLKPYVGILSATDATAKTLYLRNTFISRKVG